MFFKGKNPCVVAGLLAGMGLGVALGAAPALADDATAVVLDDSALVEVVEPADQEQAEVVEVPVSDVVVDKSTSDAVAAEGASEAEGPEVTKGAAEGDKAEADAADKADAVDKADGQETDNAASDAAEKTDDTAATDKAESAVEDEKPGDATKADDATETGKSESAADEADAVTEAAKADAASTEKTEKTDKTAAAEKAAAAEAAQVAAQSTKASATYKNQWVKTDDGSYTWYDKNGKQTASGWVVTSVRFDGTDGGGLQRYWISSDTKAVSFSKLLSVTWGNEEGYAYSTKDGWVARGKYTETDAKGNALTYLADNNGKLLQTGWVVTKEFDGGEVYQRYYIDKDAHAAIQGYSSDGWDHYTTSQGYVARGKYTETSGTTKGYVYLANNEGELEKTGWLVTRDYDNGDLQRYYIDKDAHAAKPGYSTDGWAHYTTKDGYVLRGDAEVDGAKRYADNNGLMEDGWRVTGAFSSDGGLERYYQKNGKFLTNTFFNDGGYWAYARNSGRVLRGKLSVNDKFYLADNDGRLETRTGFVVDDLYDGVKQRYYFMSDSNKGYSYAVTGIFKAKLTSASKTMDWFYGSPTEGYELRSKMKVSGGVVLANNDGQLKSATGWVVTKEYDGDNQRYYFETASEGYSYAKTGYFETVLGSTKSWFYGDVEQGYVMRGKKATDEGLVISDNEGRIQGNEGFQVTGDYDGGTLQRYYFAKTKTGYTVAKTGFFTAKLTDNSSTSWFYGDTNQGYVLRGANKMGSGVLLSTQDGILLESRFKDQKADDFLVTAEFAGDLQRYYIISVDGHLMAKYGKFSVNGNYYFGREDTGYVVRGTYTTPEGVVYRADNDGVLILKGWSQVDGVWYYTYENGSQNQFTSVAYSAWNAIQNMSSETSYLLVIDNTNCRVVAFEGGAGDWEPVYDWQCSVGVNKVVGDDVFGETVRGSFTIYKRDLMMGNDPDYYYWCEFYCPGGYDEGQRFHSMGYYRQYGTDYHNPDNRGAQYDTGLGKQETHGCVRLPFDAVKWIYYTCPNGTKVYSY